MPQWAGISAAIGRRSCSIKGISDTDLSALFLFFFSEVRFKRKYVALIFDLPKEASKCTFLQKFK